jgi:rSAM/selenodomain-associated transferase 2
VSPKVTVLIAAANEESRIGAAVDSAFAGGAAEVILCDGASTDRTGTIARERGARILPCERMRARQFNRGAEETDSEILIFLHADTTLPPGAVEAAAAALDAGSVFGGFRLAFAEASWKLRFAEAMINVRTSFTRCPWGDQAQFIHRSRFLGAGGFREISLMEDYDLAVRMKRAGRTTILPLHVTTSGRRFLERGLIRTSVINWRIIISYRMGVDPERLARMYRRDSS